MAKEKMRRRRASLEQSGNSHHDRIHRVLSILRGERIDETSITETFDTDAYNLRQSYDHDATGLKKIEPAMPETPFTERRRILRLEKKK